jgi:hypothetical protein
MSISSNADKLYDQFREIIESGVEEQAQQFLIDHFQEFPEEMRQSMVVSFVKDGIVNAQSAQQHSNEFQKQGLEALNAREKKEQELMEREKSLEHKA